MLYATGAGRQLEEMYASSGLVRFEYKHYAFLGQESLRAAEAAECANDQGMFWQYHDIIFLNQRGENQGFWSNNVFIEFAVKLELDEEVFSECLTSRKYRDAITAANLLAGERGVTGTPSVFINGVPVENGSSIDVYIQMINAALGQ